MRSVSLVLLISAIFTLQANAAVWHVNKYPGSDIEDGTSWSTGFTTIQPAIDAAYNDGGGEVWVAKGIYAERRNSFPHDDEDDTGSVMMREGVHIYGGFNGNETSRDQRNWFIYTTIIDGSTARLGAPAYHVVVGANNATLDGFTVRGGKANNIWVSILRYGAGMYIRDVSPTVSNCIFTGNVAGYDGGGMYIRNSEVSVSNCLFTDNSSRHGGGMYIHDSSSVISSCAFVKNNAVNAGALYNSGSFELVVANSTFAGNTSDKGATIVGYSVSLSITNSILWNDTRFEILKGGVDTVMSVRYSAVRGGYEGEGNISIDPRFVSEAGGDFRLRPDSPCLDAGITDGTPTTDILGIPRLQGSGIDMGAYEFPSIEHDADGDSIPDVVEGQADSDGDGLPNYLDDDSDNDGVSDLLEGVGDNDEDGIPSYLDDDSDGDGILDSVEGPGDLDNDGLINSLDIDSDGDGFWDSYEGTQDSDQDGQPDYLDMDSNNDGIPDADEPYVVYVNVNNTSNTQDGTTWETAFNTIQPAIDAPPAAGNVEVWVAEGVYDEARYSYPHPAAAQNTGSVMMKEWVDIYGGFEGNETVRGDRDWEEHQTVIDGSKARYDRYAYHVIVGASNAILDGFTVEGGRTGGLLIDETRYGAGMYNYNCSPTVSNCTFFGNAGGYGGGMYNESSSSSIINCKFSKNIAYKGSALYAKFSLLNIENCTFSENSEGEDSATLESEDSALSLSGCAFVNNASSGIHAKDSSVTVVNSTFTRNSGIAMSSTGSSLTVSNSEFKYNSDTAMYNHNSSGTVSNCLFYGNSSNSDGGGMRNAGICPDIINCTFSSNKLNWGRKGGAGMHNYQASPKISNCMFYGNAATYGNTRGGGMYNNESSPEILNCQFIGNSVGLYWNGDGSYGGGMYNEASYPSLQNCIFTDNFAGFGGAFSDVDSTSSLTNVIFAANEAKNGGALYIQGIASETQVLNCVVADNTTNEGSALQCESSNPIIMSSIIWGNVGGEISGEQAIVLYSDVQGGFEGAGNIDLDPLFVDVPGQDFRLKKDSPCVDAGAPFALQQPDFIGIPRPQGDQPDMGAYEVPSQEYDLDEDTIPDTIEADEDSDGDGLPDYNDTDSDNDGVEDSLEGLGDQDGDNIPNYLDLDSDGDGILDSDEGGNDNDGDGLINSLDQDSDGDGLADAFEGNQDTDSDGIPDFLDLDSDGDGVPDEEELPVFFVDIGNVSGIQDGNSWETAYAKIGMGIEDASSAGRGEVWVAKGNYAGYRTGGELGELTRGSGALIMRENVHIYGGFAGNETSREQRDWEANATIIDGSVSRYGIAAQHVVVGADDSTLDGFTVRGGNAQGDAGFVKLGGGMYNFEASPTVANCIFTANSAETSGGGMYNSSASPIVTNCIFVANSVEFGGSGMTNSEASTIVSDCLFEKNTGSAMSNSGASPIVLNCRFIENSDWDGSAMENKGSSPLILDSTFLRNSALWSGAISNHDSFPEIRNCSFIDNRAEYSGGVMHNLRGSPLMINCVFLNNSAENHGGVMYNTEASTTLINCTLTNNKAKAGGAMYNLDCSPIVINSILWGNEGGEIFNEGYISEPRVTYSAIEGGHEGEGNLGINPRFVDEEGGDYRLQPSSPCVDTGISDGAPDTDIQGMPRPYGDGIDMGAYELPPIEFDADGDTILDEVEGDVDSDGDGVPDYLDADSDNDGVPDLLEGLGDMDEDGIPSYLDDESDGDGILDSVEGPGDVDGDGMVNSLDLDSDGDGFYDEHEGQGDSDSDGVPDFLDLDSDGDGIPDAEELYVVYVDVGNTSGMENGASWSTAFSNIQAAIDAGAGIGHVDVWVAEGVYVASTDPGVSMKEDINLFGGFSGIETQREQRDWFRRPSIIDAGGMQQAIHGSNNATLDGFIIQNAAETGMSNYYVSPTIVNCTFTMNNGTLGGGMFNEGASPIITNCNFKDNSAKDGAGMYNYSSSPIITDCTFSGNFADNNGCGMYNDGSSPKVSECTFRDNAAIFSGGGMYNENSLPTVANCTFSDNKTYTWGGGGMYNSNSSSIVSDCVFIGNSSVNGGGMYNSGSSPTVKDSTFTSNHAIQRIQNYYQGLGGGMYNDGGYPVVDNCSFHNNTATAGGGVYEAWPHSFASSTFTNCTFTLNSAESGGGIFGDSVSPVVSNCNFRLNSAEYGGGMYNLRGWATVDDCSFTKNSADEGGGIYCWNSEATVTDCTFADNSADTGGGMYSYMSLMTITDSTFQNNSAQVNGGGMHVKQPLGQNVIYSAFVGNSAPAGGGIYTDLSPLYIQQGWPSQEYWLSVTDCVFTENSAEEGGGVHAVDLSEPSYWDPSYLFVMDLSNCVISKNAAQRGGGIYTYDKPRDDYNQWPDEYGFDMAVTDCFIAGNTAENGAGMYNNLFSPVVINSVFTANVAETNGGGIYNYHESPVMTNCTITNNSAASGGGMSNEDSTASVLNCIIWDNTGGQVSNSGLEFLPTITYSDIQGGHEGEGNIDADPLFANPEGEIFILKTGSPCIDAGLAEGAPETDMRGIPRPAGDGVDMGAYEGALGDVNLDSDIDAADVQIVINTALGIDGELNCDLNLDGAVDAADVQLAINAALGIH